MTEHPHSPLPDREGKPSVGKVLYHCRHWMSHHSWCNYIRDSYMDDSADRLQRYPCDCGAIEAFDAVDALISAEGLDDRRQSAAYTAEVLKWRERRKREANAHHALVEALERVHNEVMQQFHREGKWEPLSNDTVNHVANVLAAAKKGGGA